MTTFNRQIDRELAKALGREACRISQSGQYRTPSGRTVILAEGIRKAVSGTVSYPPSHPHAESCRGPHETIIDVVNETTLSAGKGLLGGGYHAVVLNFASATHPGGGFLDGARAQEEYLARSSALYECIRTSPMYAYHQLNHDPLYSDYMVYSPFVPVW